MKDLIKNKAFLAGFLIGLIIIGIINRLTVDYKVTEDCLNLRVYGFPFLQYERCREFFGFGKTLWLGMLGNTLFALFSSFLTGLTFKFVWSKFTGKQLK